MPTNPSIKITPLKENELEEADRIMRLAFGTFIGIPNPLTFMGDRSFILPRWRSPNVKILAARDNGRLIGSNVATRWGSFGFFGPLSVLPEYWDRGVAQRLLDSTMTVFERWGLRHTGLCTFPQSPKHLGLYQKYGYWPGYLIALMTGTPQPGQPPILLSALKKAAREQAVEACARLTRGIYKGLDLSDEIRFVLKRRVGEIVLAQTHGALDGFALCLTGPGSEGGEKLCYIKFGAARPGPGANKRFDKLLEACEAFAASRHADIEAGVNLAREGAFRQIKSRGYRVVAQLVSMQRPHTAGFNRADAYVIDDWR